MLFSSRTKILWPVSVIMLSVKINIFSKKLGTCFYREFTLRCSFLTVFILKAFSTSMIYIAYIWALKYALFEDHFHFYLAGSYIQKDRTSILFIICSLNMILL